MRAAIVRGHTLYLDFTPQVLDEDPELPLAASRAFDELKKSIHYNFPRVHEIVLYIDGQIPRSPKRKIFDKESTVAIIVHRTPERPSSERSDA